MCWDLYPATSTHAAGPIWLSGFPGRARPIAAGSAGRGLIAQTNVIGLAALLVIAGAIYYLDARSKRPRS